MKVLNISQQYISWDYPYGGRRTKAYFGVEFQPKKGFRTSFQTINPKTGFHNSVKNSTYSHFVALVRLDNDHYDWKSFQINGDESIVKTFTFISEHYLDLDLKPAMHHYMMAMALQSRSISLSFTNFVTDELKEEYKQKYHNPFIQKVKEMLTMPHPNTYKEAADLLEGGIIFVKQNVKLSNLVIKS